MARANGVWGQAPDVQLTDVTFPPCPPGAPGLPDTCVKVNAFRNQARGNALPMFFGNLVGVADQGVRATATAQILTGNTTDCLKPWAVVDRWDRVRSPRRPGDRGLTSILRQVLDGRGQNTAAGERLYVPPSSCGPARDSICRRTRVGDLPSRRTAPTSRRAGSRRSTSRAPTVTGPAATSTATTS